MARGEETFQRFDVRVAAVAFLALVAAVVRGWPLLIPLAVALVGAGYAGELVVADAALDIAAPVVAVGLFLAAELAYWSLDERIKTAGDPGQSMRRTALVALTAAAIFVVSSALLALADEIRARGLALDLIGAVAAVGVLVAVLATARDQTSKGA
jgi:hypothetical protein